MKSCDLELLSEKFSNTDYDTLVLCTGLDSTVYTGYYAKKSLYMLQGRGITLIDDLLKKLEVNYDMLSVEELANLDKMCYKDIILVLPFMDFNKIDELNEKIVYFFSIYSTFKLQDIIDDVLILNGIEGEETVVKRITLGQLKKISKLSAKPIGVTCKILKINQKEVDFAVQKNCILTSIKDILCEREFMDEDGGYKHGIGFYDEIVRILMSYWDSDFNKTMKYIFFQSMLSGSAFFYRREYYNALIQKHDMFEISINYLENLKISGNLWRTLARYLQSLVIKQEKLDEDKVKYLVSNIKNYEIEFFGQF